MYLKIFQVNDVKNVMAVSLSLHTNLNKNILINYSNVIFAAVTIYCHTVTFKTTAAKSILKRLSSHAVSKQIYIYIYIYIYILFFLILLKIKYKFLYVATFLWLFSLWHFLLKLCGWQQKVFQINENQIFCLFLSFFVEGKSCIILFVVQATL